MQNSPFLLQDSSFLIQNSSFSTQNSSFSTQNLELTLARFELRWLVQRAPSRINLQDQMLSSMQNSNIFSTKSRHFDTKSTLFTHADTQLTTCSSAGPYVKIQELCKFHAKRGTACCMKIGKWKLKAAICSTCDMLVGGAPSASINSSFLMQTSSFWTQNSSFLMQTSSFSIQIPSFLMRIHHVFNVSLMLF